ncbi:hypothetical protein PINS_up000523 [Pythium insidiosum]|nr:hypothetical protein PINS_up000523 [Pythium insidiosum]
MCPLRYILLLLSLLVAMIGFSQAMAEADQISHVPHEEEEDDTKKTTCAKSRSVASTRKQQSTFRTLIDMLNGKYLYDAWRATQSRTTIKTA